MRTARQLYTDAHPTLLADTALRQGAVEVLDLPPPNMPQLRHARSLQRQLVATTTLSRHNLPTHYLCFVTLPS